MRGIKVWVRDYDCGEPAQGVDGAYCGRGEEGEAVPEDVSTGGLQEDGALAYAEGFGGGGGGVGVEEVDGGVVVVCGKCILLRLLGFVETCPGLACGRDVLAWVLGWWLVWMGMVWRVVGLGIGTG
jgi:hypothetical protein